MEIIIPPLVAIFLLCLLTVKRQNKDGKPKGTGIVILIGCGRTVLVLFLILVAFFIFIATSCGVFHNHCLPG